MNNKVFLYISSLIFSIYLSACATLPKTNFSDYNFSLNNTLSIFLLKNGNDNFFCIPFQYIGDFQLNNFEFINGNILIGGFDIPLNRENTKIYMYHSVIDEALNQYDIFIEKYLTNSEMSNIVNEYTKGHIQSNLSIWFDLVIDNVEQKGNGMMDDFEIISDETNVQLNEYIWLLPHFELFRMKYILNNDDLRE